MSTLQRTRRTSQKSDQFPRAPTAALERNPRGAANESPWSLQAAQSEHVLSRSGLQADKVLLAVLDRGGVVVSVNAQWPLLDQTCGIPFTLCVGQALLEENASIDDTNVRTLIARAVRSALAGGLLLPATIQIPSKPPARFHNSEVAIRSRIDEKCQCVGAVLAYYERTDLMQSLTTYPPTLDASEYQFARTRTCARWFSSLTPAEWRVLRELVTHRTLKEIADRLSVSPHTVKTQVTSIYGKLGVTHRSDAVDLLYRALGMNGFAEMAIGRPA